MDETEYLKKKNMYIFIHLYIWIAMYRNFYLKMKKIDFSLNIRVKNIR